MNPIRAMALAAPLFLVTMSLTASSQSARPSVLATTERLEITALGQENICGTPVGAKPGASIKCLFPDAKLATKIGTAKSLLAAASMNCALDEDGLKCWGAVEGSVRAHMKEIETGRTEELFSGGGSVCRASTSEGLVSCATDTRWPRRGGLRVPGQKASDPVQFGPFKALRAAAVSDFHLCVIEGDRVLCQYASGSLPLQPPTYDLGHPRAIAVGQNHVCALVDSGVRCFDKTGEVTLSEPGLSNAKAIMAGLTHDCVLTAQESVACFQVEDRGSPLAAIQVPLELTREFAGVTQIAVGTSFSCALLKTGEVQCWGESSDPTVKVPAFNAPVKSIAANHDHACALLVTNEIRCWGDAGDGKLDVPIGKDDAYHITIVDSTTCYWSKHTVRCSNTYQPVHFDNQNDIQAFALSNSGSSSGCVIDRDPKGVNHVICTGPGLTPVPTDITNPTSITINAYTACAAHDGGLTCWGTEELSNVPANVSEVRKLKLGAAHGCLLDRFGLACWGKSGLPQTEVPESLRDFDSVVDFAVGFAHTCAITIDKRVTCWGNNGFGQLEVPELIDPVSIMGAINYTCATDAEGIKCWGDVPGRFSDSTEAH